MPLRFKDEAAVERWMAQLPGAKGAGQPAPPQSAGRAGHVTMGHVIWALAGWFVGFVMGLLF